MKDQLQSDSDREAPEGIGIKSEIMLLDVFIGIHVGTTVLTVDTHSDYSVTLLSVLTSSDRAGQISSLI